MLEKRKTARPRASDKSTRSAQPSAPSSDEALQLIFALLRKRTQVDFSGYKLTTIRRRIQRRMSATQTKTLEAYAKRLKSEPEEVKALYEDIFIYVTEFFRDPETFEALADRVFPQLIKDRTDESPIRIWVPGCSTGEEPYSLVIALTEFLEERRLRSLIQIFATDISEQAIQRARAGTYSRESLRNVSDERLARHFDETPGGYRIKKAVRDSVIFSRHDVTSNPPFARLDLISFRNVLIYFSPALQKRVLPIFNYALKRGGYLLLGRSETPSSFSQLFTLADKTNKIYRKVNETKLTTFRFPTGPSMSEKATPLKRLPGAFPSLLDAQHDIDRLVMSRYAPSGVVIDSAAEIIQVRGRVGAYLEIPAGQVSVNLMKMARPELLQSLRLGLQAAKQRNKEARREGIQLGREKEKRSLNLEIIPINPLAPPKERHYLVLFEEAPATPKNGAKASKKRQEELPNGRRSGSEPDGTHREQYIAQLQLELEATKEHQQSLVDEFASAQEELTSANEELQATNEELQSTNEELETAKEELQAANEELTTTNDELHNRNVELNSTIAALAKSEERFRLMVASVKDYAIFMLDPSGHIATWNEGARRFKGYEESEIIGQHFSKFYPEEDIRAGKPELELKVATTTGRFEDLGWRLRKDGSRFWANVVLTAIRSPSGELLGFAKVTRDLTERKRMEDELRKAHDELELRVAERTQELERAIRVRDEFLSIASHELKTPLTAFKLQVQMRKRAFRSAGAAYFTPERIEKMIESDEREIGRIVHLVDNMLDITRLQAGKLKLELEELDLSALVREVSERFGRQLQAAKCPISIDAAAAVVGRWDRYRIEQVFTNLLTNAMKYGPGKPVSVSVSQAGPKALLVVGDQGIGIAKEDQARIFQQFERAVSGENRATGLGLGLYIARQIVESHGGTISVRSEPGVGSKFTVELPIS